MCKMAAADVLPGPSPKHRSTSTRHCTCSTSSFVSINHRNSLAILERADLMLDLVELPRHPAVLLVHLNTLFQRHAGGHWLQQRRAETSSVTLNVLLLKNKIRLILRFSVSSCICQQRRCTRLPSLMLASLTCLLVNVLVTMVLFYSVNEENT